MYIKGYKHIIIKKDSFYTHIILEWGRDNIYGLVRIVPVPGGGVPGVEVEEPVGERGEGGEQGQGYEGWPGGPEAWPGEQEDRGGCAQHGGPQEQVDQGVEG